MLEVFCRLGKRNAVLWTSRSGNTRLDSSEIELQYFRIGRVRRFFGVKEPLLLAIKIDQCDVFIAAPGHAQVAERFGIYRKDPAGRAVLRRHVGDGSAIG